MKLPNVSPIVGDTVEILQNWSNSDNKYATYLHKYESARTWDRGEGKRENDFETFEDFSCNIFRHPRTDATNAFTVGSELYCCKTGLI